MILIFASLCGWAGEPTVVPIGKIDGAELSAVLPSEKAMILLAIAFQVIWKLVNYIWKQKTKTENKESELLERLYKMVHEIQVDVKVLKAAPGEDEIFKRLYPHIQLTVLEAMRKYKNGEKL